MEQPALSPHHWLLGMSDVWWSRVASILFKEMELVCGAAPSGPQHSFLQKKTPKSYARTQQIPVVTIYCRHKISNYIFIEFKVTNDQV